MNAALSLGAARRHAMAQLGGISPTPAADTDHLLSAATGLTRTAFRARPEAILEAPARERFEALLRRRLNGEPVAYLTGTRGFMDFDLRLDPAVLIPRPDTEQLVEAALEAPASHVLDLGCGSGCIAIALARAWPRARIDAVDASPAALACARANATALNASHIQFLEGHWLTPVAGRRYDLIVSNPPYIGANEPEPHSGDLRFEPRAALVSGPTGLEALNHIIHSAPAHLTAGGRLWLEHGWQQGGSVREALRTAGFKGVTTRHDLAGHERVSGGYHEAGA